MPVPICHRTLTHAASPCLGSACALWVPQMRVVHDAVTYEEPTGTGHCADNPAVKRVDPAKGVAGEKK